jgi:hypothetical protein
VEQTHADDPTQRPQRGFYRHLVGSLASEIAMLVVAAATGSIAAWVGTVLFATCLALAAHAAVTFGPSPPTVTPPQNRRPPWE